MKRFFVKNADDRIILSGDNHKHLALVLRAVPGEEVIVCPGDGFDYVYRITDLSKTQTELSYVCKRKNDKEPRIKLTVFSASMKSDKNELVAQKLTELGVSELFTFESEFTVASTSSNRTERMRRICEEACKQCGRAVIPRVNEEISFADVLKLSGQFDLVVFPYESAEDVDIKSFIGSASENSEIKNVALIVGAEGGFSKSEVDAAVAVGLTPVTMGKRILRAETANIVAAAAIMCELGELA